MREVPIDWEALEDAFENNAPEVHSYLHLVSGEVLRVVDGVADPEMHARITSDENYLRVESVSSREQYRWMERFIVMIDETPLRAALAEAIDGRGAFRRFKDVLMSHANDRERWFAFRSERLRVFMEAWLSAHAIVSAPRPDWPKADAEDGAAAGGKPDAAAAPPVRNPRTPEALRLKIRETIDQFGVRDLDRVLVYSEFLKARRAKRTEVGESSVVDNEVPDAPAAAKSSAPPGEPPKVKLVK